MAPLQNSLCGPLYYLTRLHYAVFQFGLFVSLSPAVLFCYYVPFRRHRQGRNLLLLGASLLFYAFGEPSFVLVMMLSIVANWAFGLWVGKRKAAGKSVKPAVVCAVALNLGIFFVFKYLVFVLTNLNLLGFQFMIPAIELPIGISFFTFQAMSYVLDVARGKAQVQPSLYKVGLYVSLFPQLIAGPIVRYTTVANEIDCREETWGDFSSGVCRFLTGLGKKVLLSNQLAVVADSAFQGGRPSSVAFAWLGGVCYILQLYYDFSGYSDMAIGLGRMFGFHFLENFNYPYISTSMTEFWRRWHISLTTWFRDYVYYPMGGSRVNRRWKVVRNLFVVWLLTGIWHGANWTFIVWGLLNYLLLMWEKYGGLGRHWPKFFGWLYTFTAFVLTCVVFRAASIGEAWSYFLALFHVGVPGFSGEFLLYLREYGLILVAAALCAAPTATWLRGKLATVAGGKLLPLWDCAAALCLLLVFLLAVCFIVKGTYNPFIYFNF